MMIYDLKRLICLRIAKAQDASLTRATVLLGLLSLYALSLCTLSLFSTAYASPSVFPENAISLHIGNNIDDSLALKLSGEMLMPVSEVDVSVSAALLSANVLNLADNYALQLATSVLLVPAWGSTPPLSFGLGADINYGRNKALENYSLHLGPMIGTDLLYSLDLPMTASLYTGIGYSNTTALSFTWTAELRYYLELDDYDIALELASSEHILVSVGLRFVFY